MPIRFSQPVLWAVFISGLMLSMGGFILSSHFEELSTQQKQQRATDLIANAINNRVVMNINALVGIRSLFLASQEVNADEFKTFTRGYLETNPDIKALEWIPRVSHDERASFEQQAQAYGQADFRIREHDDAGNMVIARTRDEYFPVYYVQPVAGNEKAIGFDLASNATRLTALQSARQSGNRIATASFNLMQGEGSQKAFLIFVPVYATLEPVVNADSAPLLNGFALGVFYINRLFEFSQQGLEQEIQGLALTLIDDTDSTVPETLYASDELGQQEHWQQQRAIQVAGRSWKLITSANQDYYYNQQGLIPYWILLGGIMLSTIMTLYLRALAQRNEAASILVNERTRDLEASESRSELIVNGAADAVITIDSIGYISTFNPAAERMFGYSAQEVMGKNVKILMPEPYHSGHDGYLENYSNTGDRHIIGIGREVTGQRKDGSTFPLHLSVGEGVIDDRPVFVGVISDMTQRKEAEQSLIAARDMAQEANRQKSIFLNMMSHELRTPLTVILGYLPIMKDKEKMPAPEVIAQMVSDMDLSGQHLLELINDLLDISKIEAGQMDLIREKVKAAELIHEVVRKFQNQAQKSQIEFRVEVDDFVLNADVKRFRQILINLIGNALKFTAAGQIIIHGCLKDDFAIFEVGDSGAGIPQSDLAHIFDAFKQADSSSTRSVGGSGLGLAITKRLVELHAGTISVQSEPGKGSVFRFTLKQ